MAKKAKPDKSSSPPPEEHSGGEGVEYKRLSTDLIDDPEQPIRTDMTPASVEELVLSIKQVGIIEPLVVKLVKGRYEVIAGHRRLYAARLAKIPEVPCFVRKATNEQTEMLKIHENLYRADIKPADEAKHFDFLIAKQKVSPMKIAQMISKSLTYVTDRLGILSYPPFLREAMDKGEVSFSVAREFSKFGDEKQMRSAVYYSKRSGMTTEMARKWVKDWEDSQNRQHGQYSPPPDRSEQPNEVLHDTTCAYCRQGLRLIEAEVVYMHNQCLVKANAVEINNPPEAEAEA
jgi:ParB family chromosome partitioning protein